MSENKKNNKPTILKTLFALLIIMLIGYGVGAATIALLRMQKDKNETKEPTQLQIVDGPEEKVMPIANGRVRIKLPPVRINKMGINA